MSATATHFSMTAMREARVAPRMISEATRRDTWNVGLFVNGHYGCRSLMLFAIMELGLI